MKCFFIPGLTSGHTETVLEMVNGFFNIHPDFIGVAPFIRSAQDTRVGAQVLLRINVKHPATGGVRAGIFTMADPL